MRQSEIILALESAVAKRDEARTALADLVAAAERTKEYLEGSDVVDMTLETGLMGAGYLPAKPISIVDVEDFAAAVERAKAITEGESDGKI